MNNSHVDHIQKLNHVDVVWADDLPSNPSESDPHDSNGDTESFVQDSEDSNEYYGVWITTYKNKKNYDMIKL